MLITALPQPPLPRRLTSSHSPNTRPTDPPGPPPEHDPELGETIARWVGKASQSLAMVPKYLDSQPWIEHKFNLHDARPGIQVAAGLAGGVSVIALTTAGALDIDDGVRHNNYAEILSGSSDIARAGFVGGWTTGRMLGDNGVGQSFLQTSNLLSGLSGALQTAGGLARMRHEGIPGNPISPKVVGLLEAGMGLTWVAATLGAPVPLCFVARMGLAAGKTVYTRHQDWHLWTQTDSRGKV